MGLENRVRDWGLRPRTLRTKDVPSGNAGVYINPGLVEEGGYFESLYDVKNPCDVGLSSRRVERLEEGNFLYSPAFSDIFLNNEKYEKPCPDICDIPDDRVIDLFSNKDQTLMTPIQYVVTPKTEDIKRLYQLRDRFDRELHTFPKIIMVPWDSEPLLITKNSKSKNKY